MTGMAGVGGGIPEPILAPQQIEQAAIMSLFCLPQILVFALLDVVRKQCEHREMVWSPTLE